MVGHVVPALDEEKSDLLTKATELALGRRGGELPPEVVGELLRDYFRHVASEDVCSRTETDLYGALASHYDLARQRPQGTARLRISDVRSHAIQKYRPKVSNTSTNSGRRTKRMVIGFALRSRPPL